MIEPYLKEMIVTDFGAVLLSPKVIAYLDRVAPRRHSTKRHRGKKYEYERHKLSKVEAAVMVCAEIEYLSGGMLETF